MDGRFYRNDTETNFLFINQGGRNRSRRWDSNAASLITKAGHGLGHGAEAKDYDNDGFVGYLL